MKYILLEALGRRRNIRRPVGRIQRESVAEDEEIEHCVGDKISRTTYLIILGSKKEGV